MKTVTHKLRNYPAFQIPVDQRVYAEFGRCLALEIAENVEGCTLPLDFGWVKVESRSFAPRRSLHKKGEDSVVFKEYNLATGGLVYTPVWRSEVIKKKQGEKPGEAFDTAKWYRRITSLPFRVLLNQMVRSGHAANYHVFASNAQRKKSIK